MRKYLIFLFVSAITSACSSRNAGNLEPTPALEPVVLAYVTSWNDDIITHINYSFVHVNDEFNGVRIDNEERLKLNPSQLFFAIRLVNSQPKSGTDRVKI